MAASHNYRSHRITVRLHKDQLVCTPDPLPVDSNTIATITWIPAPHSDFTFLQFTWLTSNGFLAQDPIIHEQCIVAVVNNTAHDAIGEWAYQVKVQVGDHVYQTPPQPGCAPLADGHPKIHNL